MGRHLEIVRATAGLTIPDTTSTPPSPASGEAALYWDGTGTLHVVDSSGADHPIINSAAAALGAWPVGSVYLSFSSTNPGSTFGGTWSAIGQGRMLVGVDSSDTDFNAAGKTGGEKTHTLVDAEVPATNIVVSGTSTVGFVGGNSRGDITVGGAVQITGPYAGGQGKVAGGGGAHNNMSPYLAVYMWRRTA